MRIAMVVVALANCVLVGLTYAQHRELTALRAEVVERDKAQDIRRDGKYKIILGHAADLHDIGVEIAGIDARLDKEFGRSVELLDRVIAIELKRR